MSGTQDDASRARHRLRILPAPATLGRGSIPIDQGPLEVPAQPRPRSVSPADVPRVEGLDALLREVDELRSSLRQDLTLAATAVQAGEPGLAAYAVGAGEPVRVFQERALAHLTTLHEQELADSARHAKVGSAGHRQVGARGRKLLPAAPLVAAAAALFGFLAGVGPSGVTGSPPTISASVADSLATVSRLASDDAPAAELSAAASALHASLAPLVARAATDPRAAEQALSLLQVETDILQRSNYPGQLADVIREAQMLVRQLRAALPAGRPSVQAPARLPVTTPPTPTSTETAGSPPAPSASAKPSAAPSATPSSPPSSRPSGSPNPTPSSSATPGVLPAPPAVGR